MNATVKANPHWSTARQVIEDFHKVITNHEPSAAEASRRILDAFETDPKMSIKAMQQRFATGGMDGESVPAFAEGMLFGMMIATVGKDLSYNGVMAKAVDRATGEEVQHRESWRDGGAPGA